ncbi:MAG: glycine oxidase ThiO [Armatimonadota bacterium]|nr:glycine oxidase ThiO [Armatimonadota bacterium]
MTKTGATDFLILGGGVIGLSTAYHLSRQGASVMVLDAGEPGQASAAAAGMLAPLAETSAPGPFLDLALDSLRRYPEYIAALREETGQELQIHGPGMLRVARTDEEEAALCRALAWQPSLGLPLTRLTGAEVRRLEPSAASDIQAAVLSPMEKYIEPRRLLAVLAAACRRHGVQIISDYPATALQTSAGRTEAILAGSSRHTFGNLVVSVGAWSRILGQWLGFDFPVTPLRGQMLALGPQSPSLLSHTLYTHGAYLVPRPDGRIVAGATEEWAGFTPETTEAGIAGLRQEAARLVPMLAEWPLHSAWAGLRPVSVDGLPLLGRLPGWENVHIATGHGRNGILLTPVTGALMADYLLRDVPLPVAFDPARFSPDSETL